jgi:hypothetical protein
MHKILNYFLLASLCLSLSAEATTQAWDLSQGRLVLSGAGTNIGIFGIDGMQPLVTNESALLFSNLMGDYGTDNTYVISPGAGYRKIENNQIVGAYFFGDYEKVTLGQEFWSVSPGVEWITPIWDGHLNGYFPTTTSQQMGSSVFASTQGNNSYTQFEEGTHNQYDKKFAPYDVIGDGFDIEVGYSFQGIKNFRSRAYLGGYFYYPPNVESITGVTVGFEEPISKWAKISVFNSYDQLNHDIVGVSLSVTFGGESNIFSHNVEDRLLDQVQRHVGVIGTGAGTYDQEHWKDQGSYLQYDNVYFTSPNGVGNGTYGNPASLSQETLDSIYAESSDGARIYLQGGSDANYNVNNENTDTSGLRVYSNQDFYGRNDDYTTPAETNEQPNIIVDESGYSAFITQGGANTFSDLNITSELSDANRGILSNNTNGDETLNIINTTISGFHDGIEIINTGTSYTLNTTNAHFDSNRYSGVVVGMEAESGSVEMNLNNATFNNNAEYGFGVINQSIRGSMAINSTSSEFNGNSKAGLFLYNDATGNADINLTHSQFNDNGEEGVSADADTQSGDFIITATSSQFNNNGLTRNGETTSTAAGIFAVNSTESHQMTINATNSEFNNNGYVESGGDVDLAGGIIAYNLGDGSFAINADGTSFNNNGNIEAGGHVDYSAGLMALNNEGGTFMISAPNSTFNGNGFDAGGTVNSGIYAANFSTGTLSITNVDNSTFANNGNYGIYGLAGASSSTTIDYSGASFSGSSQISTNQTSGDHITWID